jgi:hypothetical protein
LGVLEHHGEASALPMLVCLGRRPTFDQRKRQDFGVLKSIEKYATNQILSFNLSHFHGQLFGNKQLV